MDIIEQTRALGKMIQQDERYLAFMEAKKANDEDAALNELIGKLKKHLQFAVRSKSRKHTGCVHIVKQLSSEFQIKLVSELSYSLFNMF